MSSVSRAICRCLSSSRRRGVLGVGGDECRLVELHVGEVVRHLERMAEVGLPGTADLPLVGLAGEDVGLAEGGNLLLADVGSDLFEDVVKPDHGGTASPVRGCTPRA